MMDVAFALLTALAAEWAFCWICGRPCTLRDGSALVTGILLALCLPATVPLYIPFLCGLFRVLGNAADGVSYDIIFSNMLSPIIDQFIVPRPCAYRGYKVSTARTH